MHSGPWIGSTEPEQFPARLACQCHHPIDAEQPLLPAWPSTAVRHATRKSDKAHTGRETGTTGTGQFLVKFASPLRPAREAAGAACCTRRCGRTQRLHMQQQH
eukprot:6309846-Karenia_brevis.AAC.1